MATITEAAGELLQRVQAEQGLAAVLRVEPGANGLVIGTSAAAPDDEVLFHDGRPVLRLSPEASAALAGCTIATQDTPEGPRLTILPPDAA